MGQKRGRNLHKAHATAHNACGKAGKIADNAATQRDNHIVPLNAGSQQELAHLLQPRIAFTGFSGCQDKGLVFNPVRIKNCGKARKMEARHVLVRDNGHPLALEERQQQRARLCERPSPTRIS